MTRTYRCPPRIARLVRLSADLCAVDAALILSDHRQVRVSRARFAVYWAAHHGLPLQVTSIGRYLGGRDHNTIAHGLRRAEQLRASDPAFRSLTDRVLAAAMEAC